MTEDVPQRFAACVARGDDLPLAEACVLIAQRSRPSLEVAAELARLDELAAGVEDRSVDGVVRHLFDELGFSGDRATYHDARNSLLPDVLDRRLGIPISLAIVAIEVGHRCDVPLVGIGMPGHFLVGDGRDTGVYVDVFDGGTRLDVAQCRAVFERLHPRVGWDDRYLAPVGATAIVTRVLANLANAHRRAGDREGLVAALELRLQVPDASVRASASWPSSWVRWVGSPRRRSCWRPPARTRTRPLPPGCALV